MKYILLLLFFLVGCSGNPQFKKGDAVYDSCSNTYGYVVQEAAGIQGRCKVLLIGNYTKENIVTWYESKLISMYSLGYFHGNAKQKKKYEIPQYEDGWNAGAKDRRNTTYQK